MKNKKTYYMILTAIFTAIIFMLALVPNVGYIMLVPGIELTIIHIPVLIGVFILPLTNSLFLGFSFGLSSLIIAAMRGSGAFTLAFLNPLVSILPRVLFALVAHYILVLFKKISLYRQSKAIIFTVVTVIMSVAIFFSVNFLTTQQVAHNKQLVEDKITNLTNESGYNQEEYELLLTEKEVVIQRGHRLMILSYVLIGVAILIVTGGSFYLIYFSKYKNNYYHIPSVFILSTFFHTLLVLFSVIVFKPTAFFETFGNDQSVIRIIMLIAVSNGFAEAIISAIVGTPIVVAILQKLGDDNVITN